MGKSFGGIRSRLFFPVLTVLFISVSVLSFLNIRISADLLKNQITESTSKSLSNIRENFSEEFLALKVNLDQIYEEKDFIRDLTDELPEEKLRQNYASLARSFATTKIPTDSRVDAFYIYTADHKCISHYRRADTPTYRYPTDIYDDSDPNEDLNSDKVREYVESDRSDFMLSGYYNPYREKNVLRFVYKIYVNNRGKLVGYLVCDTDERMMTDRIESYTYYDGQVVCIQPIGDCVSVFTGKPEKTQRKILDTVSEKIRSENFTVNTNNLISNIDADMDRVFITSLSRYGIIFYSLYPEDMLRDKRGEMILAILSISGVILIAVVLFVWNYSNKVSGEFALMQKNADYKALQAQINPHFLYNTLETMSSIARRKKCEEISDLCLALSAMFRYSMGVKESIVPVQKEIEHIRNYLYVMTTRMQNNIEISLDLKNEHMGLMIPKLTIQPIVENSIKHGLSGVRGEKSLKIYSEENGEKVSIIVEDNGSGMNADEINKWLNSNDREEQKESIGLRNIHRRLQLLFGTDYGLKLERDEEISRVRILIPKKIELKEAV
ncbi:sensor histidine kinase [Lachnospiraceae bacterium C1.1]|nr:histidine kinase [Lachnospiraceae bacterium C1.1]